VNVGAFVTWFDDGHGPRVGWVESLQPPDAPSAAVVLSGGGIRYRVSLGELRMLKAGPRDMHGQVGLEVPCR